MLRKNVFLFTVGIVVIVGLAVYGAGYLIGQAHGRSQARVITKLVAGPTVSVTVGPTPATISPRPSSPSPSASVTPTQSASESSSATATPTTSTSTLPPTEQLDGARLVPEDAKFLANLSSDDASAALLFGGIASSMQLCDNPVMKIDPSADLADDSNSSYTDTANTFSTSLQNGLGTDVSSFRLSGATTLLQSVRAAFESCPGLRNRPIPNLGDDTVAATWDTVDSSDQSTVHHDLIFCRIGNLVVEVGVAQPGGAHESASTKLARVAVTRLKKITHRP